MSLTRYHQIMRLVEGVTPFSLSEVATTQEAYVPSLEPSVESRHKDFFAKLASAIDQLSAHERLVLTLYYYEELRLQEISEVLHLPEARVDQIHAKAVARVRQELMTEVRQ